MKKGSPIRQSRDNEGDKTDEAKRVSKPKQIAIKTKAQITEGQETTIILLVRVGLPLGGTYRDNLPTTDNIAYIHEPFGIGGRE